MARRALLRRVLRIGLLSIVLGAIVNVFIAWTACLTVTSAEFHLSLIADCRYAHSDRPIVSIEGTESLWIDWVWGGRALEVVRLVDNSSSRILLFRAGWPYRSMQGFEYSPTNLSTSRYGSAVVLPWTIELSSDIHSWRSTPRSKSGTSTTTTTQTEARILPLSPIWEGWLANTFLFAAMFAPIMLIFVLLPPFVRALRSRCPRCGYDLRWIDMKYCPECGWRNSCSFLTVVSQKSPSSFQIVTVQALALHNDHDPSAFLNRHDGYMVGKRLDLAFLEDQWSRRSSPRPTYHHSV